MTINEPQDTMGIKDPSKLGYSSTEQIHEAAQALAEKIKAERALRAERERLLNLAKKEAANRPRSQTAQPSVESVVTVIKKGQ